MSNQELKRSILSRHIVMISLGGTISASFFLGVGSLLNTVGAFGMVLGFIIGGLLMMTVLVSLAEMAVAIPVCGSFQSYATTYISKYIGFLTGWLYLINWVTAAAASLIAAGIICNNFFPIISVWMYCSVFIILVSTLNFLSVRVFAEIEFWLAGVKIVTIIVFIIIGLLIISGFLHTDKPIVGLVNFYADGLFPNGFKNFAFGLVIIVCTFQGAELVGIAAGETKDPAKNIIKAIKTVAFRIIIFFVLSTFIISYIIPYKDSSVIDTPFVTILKLVNIKYIDTIMQLVILTASLSAINSAFYACARLLWSMSKDKQAPKVFMKINKSQIPYYGVIFTAIISCICLLSSFMGAEKIFILIISSSGMIGCLIWLIISLCHIKFRQSLSQDEINNLKFRAIGFPYIPYISITVNTLIILGMLCDPDQRIVVFSGLVLILIFSLMYKLFYQDKNA